MAMSFVQLKPFRPLFGVFLFLQGVPIQSQSAMIEDKQDVSRDGD